MRVQCVRFVAGSQTIVSASEDKTIAVWEWEKSDSLITVLEGHDDCVRSIAVSSAGDRLFSGSQDRTLRFWDLTARLQTEEFVQSSAIWTVAISADDMKLAIGLENGAVKVLDIWTGETVFEDTEAYIKPVYSVEFSPDGKRLVAGSRGKILRLWDTENWARIGSIVGEHFMVVSSFAFSRNGQQVVSGGAEGTVRLWDVVPAQSDCNSSNGPVLSRD